MSINTARLESTDTYSVSFVVCTYNGDRILRPYAEYGHTVVIVIRNSSTIDSYMSAIGLVMTVTNSRFNVNTCLFRRAYVNSLPQYSFLGFYILSIYMLL